jgi:predicted ArsR family transcriptional regulator
MSSDHLENRATAISSRPAAGRLLLLLKNRGPQTASQLGKALRVTSEAARQQLEKLAAEGLVDATPRVSGVGRPSKMWSITAQGNAGFPDSHAALTVDLITAMKLAFGPEGLGTLLSLRAKQQIAAYRERLRGHTSLRQRLEALAEIRSEEGYMAEVLKQDGGFLLVENHCPICAAATACVGLCGAELEVFQKTLGNDVEIERIEHILAGARRCAYRIGPRAGVNRKAGR